MQNKVYAQVYSLIRTFSEGLIDALKYFSEIGYDGVELIGTNTGDLSEDEFVDLLKKLNLKVSGMRLSGKKEDLEFAKKVGAKYLSTDVSPVEFTREEALGFCKKLNEVGKELKEQGFMQVLHNHSEEFFWIKGEEGKTRVYDVIMENTNPEYLAFELDTGWAAYTGADIVEYVKKAPERFPVIHVKECTRIGKTVEELEHFPKSIFNANLPRNPQTGAPMLTEEQKAYMYETRSWNGGLGQGIIDWKGLVDAATSCIAFISEREYYHYDGSDGTPECCAKLDYEFMRSL